MSLKSKRSLFSLFAFIVILALLATGCQPSQPATPTAPASSTVPAATEPAVTEKIVIKFAHHMQLDQAIQGMAEEFAKDVAEKTNGAIEVQVFGASQIGGLKDNTDAMRYGTLEMGLSDLGTIATIYPLAGIGGLPFLYRDYDHVDKVYDGPVGQKLTDEIAQAANIRILGFTHSGFRSIISKNKGVDSPEAAKNMKIRVPEIPMYLNTIKAFGANPTPIPLNEVYTSLQTGVVEGMECPNDILYTSKFYEVTDYICRSRHIYSDSVIAMSETVYQKLTPEQQQIMQECVKDLVTKHRKAIVEMDDEYYNNLVAAGLQEVTPNTEAFLAAVKPVWDEFAAAQNAQELIDQIVNTK